MLPDGRTVVGRTGSLMGPIKWMAPELLREEIDTDGIRFQSFNEYTDTYMFGVFLWEVFARSEPYPGLTDLKAAHFIAHDNGAPDISACRCPQSYRELVASCLARDPLSRPSMDIVANNLRELCEDLKIKAEKGFFRTQTGVSGVTEPELRVPKHSPSSSISLSQGGHMGGGGGGGGGALGVDSSSSLTSTSFGYTKMDTGKEEQGSEPTVFLHLPGQLENRSTTTTPEGSTPPPTDSLILHSSHSESTPTHASSVMSNYLALHG